MRHIVLACPIEERERSSDENGTVNKQAFSVGAELIL